MTDRELLEKAAKAAGYKPDGKFGRGLLVVRNAGTPDMEAFAFDSINDSGDALDLAVALRIDLQFSEAAPQHAHPRVTAWVGTPTRFDEFVRENPAAAARRAITRAAAAIYDSQQGDGHATPA